MAEYSFLIYAIFVFIIGLMFGSFATMASYRIPHQMNMVSKRSACPACGHLLGIRDLFPLFSWLIARGKCRYCHTPVSVRYPLIELSTGLLFLLIFFQYGLQPPLLYTSLWIYGLAVTLVIMTSIDMEYLIIPDGLQITLAILGIGYRLTVEPFLGNALFHMITLPLILVGFSLGLRYVFFWWKKKEALGLGDVKLFAVIGLWLSFEHLVALLFLSGILGIFIAMAWRLCGKGERFPFGPALGGALLICVIFPTQTHSDAIAMLYQQFFLTLFNANNV